MPFTEKIKIQVKQKADFRYCRCHKIGIDIHHITSEAEGGNKINNAAPLCQNCHDRFGGNPKKRKEIRKMRDRWYKIVKNKYQRDEKRWLEINEKLLEIAKIQEKHTVKMQLIEAKILGF